ncbi:Outer membrane protein beta-barrel domain-containing protein [Moraxella cuniculi DSM 21768]|uniref:Outer membrane protein beta-barrel domain-containing protein n=2 Tax=Moraxella cuniculi TaxID=34061 RepID=A0A1N7F6D9_9GAMM|nr:outer membrane beta-barrel protein [Moraxella cuniculi]OOS06452.1 cell envelope biogenesis protein OmpA [Moraxella cuniculi]SIR95836.1 Outer membrane protein beta-barrel domain-containing protein [Moraxella cuniculi DSM 21768]VEG12147.1 Uncharacterised protein [Moraxella cuniculi]
MKTVKTLLALTAASLLSVGANAAISYGSSPDAQPYVGVKAGMIDADQISGKMAAYGLYAGYNFDQNFGAEAELVRSSSKDFQVNNSSRQGEVKTMGIYGTYRYNFVNTPFYAKGKLGIARTEVDVEGRNGSSYTSNVQSTGLAGGVGAGFKVNSNIGVEASYNYLSDDASMLGVGAHLAF